MATQPENNVDAYISQCPKEVQVKLYRIRKAIREVVPDATERTDYFQIPGYSYGGYDYNGMFVWFSFKKPNLLRLHVRPPVIQDNGKELSNYAKTKAIVSFPTDQELPIGLVKKLVKASLAVMKTANKD